MLDIHTELLQLYLLNEIQLQNNYQHDDTYGLSFISGLVVLHSTYFELQGAHHQEFTFLLYRQPLAYCVIFCCIPPVLLRVLFPNRTHLVGNYFGTILIEFWVIVLYIVLYVITWSMLFLSLLEWFILSSEFWVIVLYIVLYVITWSMLFLSLLEWFILSSIILVGFHICLKNSFLEKLLCAM